MPRLIEVTPYVLDDGDGVSSNQIRPSQITGSLHLLHRKTFSSPNVRESKTILDSGFHSVDSGSLPWVPEVFLARGGNFRCWPKADTSSAVEAARKNSGHYKDLTETGNRARKVSGTLIWHPGYRIPGTGFQSLSVGLGF